MTAKNRAWRIYGFGGGDVLHLDEIPYPSPEQGQVLVKVGAAGVNGIDWKYRSGMMQKVYPLQLPAVLGAELAGTVIQVATGASRFEIGDRVMGAIGRGAYSEYVAIAEQSLCPTPAGLSDIEAAALPIAAQTGEQVVNAAGELSAGQTVLIHGAAGGVGGFAVQFAKAAGAVVIATAAGTSHEYLLALGADKVIDRHSARFEDEVNKVDLVIDLVGGEMSERSWAVLEPGGAVVTIAAPDIAGRVPDGFRGLFHSMRGDTERLRQIAEAVASGTLRSAIAGVFGFTKYHEAIQSNVRGHAPGKIVLDFNR